MHACRIPPGGRGYCGLRRNENGRMVHLAGTPGKGLLEWYHDPLPTNCVADWVCAGGSGAGYPVYSYTEAGPELGYRNLAVFYKSCTLDCLYCQNWQHRQGAAQLKPLIAASELAGKVDERTSCICYFGGDPASQMLHALRTSEIALRRKEGRILRICWETNGTMERALLRRAAALSLKTGGCVKVDLKAWDERLHIALTGSSNRVVLSNFKWLAGLHSRRAEPPLVVASTLLVPGYVEEEEVEGIARFISSLDPEIPYSLLAYSPEYMMRDLPFLTREKAMACLQVAREHLENVRLGNQALLRA